MRRRPSLRVSPPKLINRPTGKSIRRMYVRSCLGWTGASFSTDLSSTTTRLSTNRVGTEAVFKYHAVVFKPDRFLTLHLEAATFEHSGQHDFVDRFEKARPEIAVELDRGIDDGAGDFVEFSHGLGRVGIGEKGRVTRRRAETVHSSAPPHSA